MKKRIFIIVLSLALTCALGAIYINAFILPSKIREMIIQGIQETTHKKAKLASLEFNLFKGIVIKDLVIYDEFHDFISLKECSFNILLPSLFFKKVVIPVVNLNSLSVNCQRDKDGGVDILGLLPKSLGQNDIAKKNDFNFFIYKIIVKDSNVHFKDAALPVEVEKTIDKLNIVLYLSLPASVKFSLNFVIPGELMASFAVNGDYKINQEELWAKVSFRDLSPADYLAYYKDLGVTFKQGIIDGSLNLKYKDSALYSESQVICRKFLIFKDTLSFKLDSKIEASLKYDLKDNQAKFSGFAQLDKLDISGIDLLGSIDSIRGKVNFSDTLLSADNLSALIYKLPVLISLNLTDFNNPLLKLDLLLDQFDLEYAQGLLKEKFNLVFPAQAQGVGKLALKIESRLPFPKDLLVSGVIDISKAKLKIDNLSSPVDDINARFAFTSNQIKWQDVFFKYLDVKYKTEGALDDFNSPNIKFKLSSADLFLDSDLNLKGKLLKLNRVEGKYRKSDFLIKGDVDIASVLSIPVNLALEVNFDTEGVGYILDKYKDKIATIKPSGIINLKANLSGNIKEVKDLNLAAKLSSGFLSAYGYKASDFAMEYNQENGVADIPMLALGLYDGKVEANAKINLASDNQPYLVNAKISDIKLEKLKLDTQGKDKDVSGVLGGQIKINGTIKDPLGISGIGRVAVSQGKLWELNLFQGLGKILFAKDFANINIKDGSCDFAIQDKTISTDNIKMTGDLIDLTGVAKIGFDGAIDSSLNVHINDEEAPISGTFKDVTTAILGQAGRFGIIKISGNIADPKYKFQSGAVDMLKALKDALFGG